MELGERIRKMMLEKGYSYDRLAEDSGWSKQSLMSWCRCRTCPNALAMIDLARVFKVTIGELYGEEDG